MRVGGILLNQQQVPHLTAAPLMQQQETTPPTVGAILQTNSKIATKYHFFGTKNRQVCKNNQKNQNL